MERLTTSGPGACYIRRYNKDDYRHKVFGKNEKNVPAWEVQLSEIQQLINHLSAYEDTGLTPAEILKLDLVNRGRVFSVSEENAEEIKELLDMGVMQGPGGEIKPIEAFFQYDLPVFLDKGATLPTRAHDTDAGLDLYSNDEDVVIEPGDSRVFDTGVHVKLPIGHYGKIESKSGLNVHHGIVSCGGVIDEGYTGSIMVKLYNLGICAWRIDRGDKIAQLIVQPCEYVTVKQVHEWNNDTPRGDNGFGSTGR